MSHRGTRFLPSPTWFAPRIMDTSLHGHLAFGTKSTVMVLDIRDHPMLMHSYPAHETKIVTVSFCKSKKYLYLATSSDEGDTKIWDLTESPKAIHSFRPSNRKPALVEWKYESDDTVFVASGRVLKEWRIDRNIIAPAKTHFKDDIVLLASCANNPNLLAVGQRCGNIHLVDLLNFRIYAKLYGHSCDITSLSWHITSTKQLLSASADGQVRTWVLDGRENGEVVYRIYSDTTGGRKFDKRRHVIGMYHPSSPDVIIGSNSIGDIHCWEDKDGEPRKVLLEDHMGSHDKIIFAMIKCNFNNSRIITYSVDRLMIFWDVQLNRSIHVIHTFSSTVQDMLMAPIDSYRLGIATRDGNIRIWNTGSTGKKSVKSYNFGMKGCISCIAWHPKDESLLAFTSEDGRLGILNTMSNKAPTYFQSNHGHTVYGMCWGPCPMLESKSHESHLYLYSCGKGMVLISNMSNFAESTNFEDLIDPALRKEGRPDRSEISWKPDYSLFAVGSDNGDIEIFRSDFALMAVFHGIQKQVQCLRWHPTETYLRSAKSPHHNLLACSSNDIDVYVLDVTQALEKYVNETITIAKPFCQLKGHSCKVSHLCWSPHMEGQLATASNDWTVQVWDVLSNLPLANFQEHRGRVYAVEWSRQDADVIYSSGDDSVIFQWRISEQNAAKPPAKRGRKTIKKQIRKYLADNHAVVYEDETPISRKGGISNSQSGSALPNAEAAAVDEGNTATNEVRKSQSETSVKPPHHNQLLEKGDANVAKEESDCKEAKHFRTVLVQKQNLGYFKELNNSWNNLKRSQLLKDSMALVDEVTRDGDASAAPEEGDKLPSYLAIFRVSDALDKALSEEASDLKNSNSVVATNYQLWRGNIKPYLLELAEHHLLQEFHLSYAPMVSRAFWVEMCEKFASQMIQQRNFSTAVTYLILCSKYMDAINVAKEYGSLKEALAVARMCLPEDDPAVFEILELLGKQYDVHNLPEAAVNSFIAAKKPLKAAASICKREDAPSALLAAYICRKFKHPEDALMYTRKCVHMAFSTKKWKVAMEAVALEPSVEDIYTPLITVHEAIVGVLHGDDMGFGMESEILFSNNLSDNAVIWKSNVVGEVPYLQYLWNLIPWAELTDRDPDYVQKAMAEIKVFQESSRMGTKLGDLTSVIATCVMQFLLTLYSEPEENVNLSCLRFLNAAFSYSLQAVELNFLNIITQLLFPCDVTWDCQRKTFGGVFNGDNTLRLSFLSDLLVQKLSGIDVIELLKQMNLDDFSFEINLDLQASDIKSVTSTVDPLDGLVAYFCMNLADEIAMKFAGMDTEDALVVQKEQLLEDVLSTSTKSVDDLEQIAKDPLELNTEKSLVVVGEVVELSESPQTIIESACPKIPDAVNGNGMSRMLRLLELCAGCVCKDAFMIKSYLNKKKLNLQKSLMAINFAKRNKDVERPGKPSDIQDGSNSVASVDSLGLQNCETVVNGDDTRSPDNVQADDRVEESAKNKFVNGDVTNDVSSDTDRLYNHFLEVFAELEDELTVNSFPESESICRMAMKIGTLSSTPRVTCPEEKIVAEALTNQLVVWIEKFNL